MNLPYLTADLPGIPGTLKHLPADFQVEEVPAYPAAGEGEHLFLWIEKEDVSAEQLVKHIASILGMRRDEVGVAGLKDRRAITRQWVSVATKSEGDVEKLNTDSIRVLQAVRHRNKLKTGHLKGNRFSILLRTPPEFPLEEAVKRAEAIVAKLRELGVPNYFGEQRFGFGGETSQLGFALLRGEKTSKDIPPARRKFLLKFALSAAQSELFNLALAERMSRSELRTVMAGDLMRKTETGGLFVAENPPVEQERLDRGETQVTGPLYGPKMPRPTGEPAAREAAILAEAGLEEAAFSRYPKLTSGARRPYLVPPSDLSFEAETGSDGSPVGLRFAFTLPSGVYATMVLREITKLDSEAMDKPDSEAME